MQLVGIIPESGEVVTLYHFFSFLISPDLLTDQEGYGGVPEKTGTEQKQNLSCSIRCHEPVPVTVRRDKVLTACCGSCRKPRVNRRKYHLSQHVRRKCQVRWCLARKATPFLRSFQALVFFCFMSFNWSSVYVLADHCAQYRQFFWFGGVHGQDRPLRAVRISESSCIFQTYCFTSHQLLYDCPKNSNWGYWLEMCEMIMMQAHAGEWDVQNSHQR